MALWKLHGNGRTVEPGAVVPCVSGLGESTGS